LTSFEERTPEGSTRRDLHSVFYAADRRRSHRVGSRAERFRRFVVPAADGAILVKTAHVGTSAVGLDYVSDFRMNEGLDVRRDPTDSPSFEDENRKTSLATAAPGDSPSEGHLLGHKRFQPPRCWILNVAGHASISKYPANPPDSAVRESVRDDADQIIVGRHLESVLVDHHICVFVAQGSDPHADEKPPLGFSARKEGAPGTPALGGETDRPLVSGQKHFAGELVFGVPWIERRVELVPGVATVPRRRFTIARQGQWFVVWKDEPPPSIDPIVPADRVEVVCHAKVPHGRKSRDPKRGCDPDRIRPVVDGPPAIHRPVSIEGAGVAASSLDSRDAFEVATRRRRC
jgi:hypothetical protein